MDIRVEGVKTITVIMTEDESRAVVRGLQAAERPSDHIAIATLINTLREQGIDI